MNSEALKLRTKSFARRIVRLMQALPDNLVGRTLGGQLLRSGTSVAANYRAACRAKSRPDFVSKMGTVEEEADESAFWIELLVEERITRSPDAAALLKEAGELTAIAVASINTARGGPRANPHSALRTPQ